MPPHAYHSHHQTTGTTTHKTSLHNSSHSNATTIINNNNNNSNAFKMLLADDNSKASKVFSLYQVLQVRLSILTNQRWFRLFGPWLLATLWLVWGIHQQRDAVQLIKVQAEFLGTTNLDDTTTTSISEFSHWCYLNKALAGNMFRSAHHSPHVVEWLAGCWAWLEAHNATPAQIEYQSHPIEIAPAKPLQPPVVDDPPLQLVDSSLAQAEPEAQQKEAQVPNENNPSQPAVGESSQSIAQAQPLHAQVQKELLQQQQHIPAGNRTLLRAPSSAAQEPSRRALREVELPSPAIALDEAMFRKFLVNPLFPHWNRPFFHALGIPILLQDDAPNERPVFFAKPYGKEAWFGNSHACYSLREQLWKSMGIYPPPLFFSQRTSSANAALSLTANSASGQSSSLESKAALTSAESNFVQDNDEKLPKDPSPVAPEEVSRRLQHPPPPSSYSQQAPVKMHIGLVERPSRRLIIDSENLAEGLSKHFPNATVSYRTVDDDMTLEDQAGWFALQDIVILAHGAGVTNVIFMRPQSQVLELFPKHYFSTTYQPLAQQCGVHHDWFYEGGANPDQDMQGMEPRDRLFLGEQNIHITLEQLTARVEQMVVNLKQY